MYTTVEDQPVPLVMRADLTAQLQLRNGQRYWVLKDPMSLRYHQLRDEEYTVLQMLDGTSTLTRIRDRFEEKFAPIHVSYAHLQALLGMLHQQGLVQAETSGQGEQLAERFADQRWRRLRERFSNVLAIRFRGIDPERFLTATYPCVRWCFHPLTAALAMLLVVAAVFVLVTQFDHLQSRLPSYQSYFTASNLGLLAIAIAGTKILHELGHAYACKHFGGECHEIGFMLLVFTPCLYCNVSDTWLLSNKWHRIVVSAAGIYVELVLASLATFLWWWSEPGLFNSFCLYTMVVCSVGTLLFNANPLLRYDGYFVLSDWLDEPNMWQRSRGIVANVCGRLFFGQRYAVSHDPGRRTSWLFLYGVASLTYLWLVLAAILWFLWSVFEPLGLQVLVQIFMVAVGFRMLIAPTFSLVKFMSTPTNRRRIHYRTLVVRAGLAGTLVTLALMIPLPNRVVAPMVIEPENAARVYVQVAGTLREAAPLGTVLQTGDVIARLDQAELTREITALEGELSSKQARLRHLETMRAIDREFANQIPAADEAVKDAAARLQQRIGDRDRLTLRAARDGTLLASPERTDTNEARELRSWQGQPLDAMNRGCFLETGTLCCLIGDPASYTASIFIHQNDVESVSQGQRVRIRFDGHAGDILQGHVASMSKIDAAAIPPQLASQIATMSSSKTAGELQAEEIWYQAHVALANRQPLIAGTYGRAKIVVDQTSLGWRLYRYLRRTFTFHV